MWSTGWACAINQRQALKCILFIRYLISCKELQLWCIQLVGRSPSALTCSGLGRIVSAIVGKQPKNYSFYCRNSVCSRNSPQPCLDPSKSEWHDGQRQINEAGKCIRENTALRTKFKGGVRVQACHAAVWIEFAFWPLRRDYHSGVQTSAGGGRRSDWPARVLANDVSTRIDR